MASNTYTRKDASGQIRTYSRKGTQGRPKQCGKKYDQRLWLFDEERMKAHGIENKNQFVRMAVHLFLDSIENNECTELVKT